MESDDDVTTFTICKIESMVALQNQKHGISEDSEESEDFKFVAANFHKIFNMLPEEKLVKYYACK